MSLEAHVDAQLIGTKSVSGSSPPLSPPLSPIQPTTLCGKKEPFRACLPDREEADILDKIWPGSHNITLLTRFFLCHFAGDWSAYLLFAHRVHSQSQEHQDSEIHLNQWLSSKLDSDVGGMLEIANSGDINGASWDKGGSNLGSNLLCNKTVVDIVDLVHPDFTGNLTGTLSPPQHASPLKTSGNSSCGHPDICTMFPAVCVQTLGKITVAQAMEDNVALQESKAGAHCKWVEALHVKFATAAVMKSTSKEKGVSWASGATPQLGFI